ncbi:MAG: hypothetical protein F6K31_41180 [Symploca sp. SIO2G7]|nr:hypothetical protein [Symploca sp. SIO2G7]
MGKFSKAIESSNQETNKPINQQTNKQRTDDMKLVNVGGFKVPKCVRAHWVAQGAIKGEKLAPLLRDFLIERYGLPDGVTMDDFKIKP